MSADDTSTARTVTLEVHGMTCQGCASTVERGLQRLDGVTGVTVDESAGTATVTGGVDPSAVRERILTMGYDLDRTATAEPWSRRRIATVVTLVLAVVVAGLLVFTQVSGTVTAGGTAEAVATIVTSGSPAAFGLAFLLGLVAAFAPSSLAMAPAVMGAAVEGHAHSRRHTVGRAVAFVAGVLVVDAVVGAAFAAGGEPVIAWLEARLALWFGLMFLVLAGLAVIVLGIWRPTPPRLAADRLPEADGLGGAFLAGIPFGLLACPSCTPMLLPVILGAAATGDPVLGAAMLATFGLGRGLPLVAVGASAGLARRARSLRQYVPTIERVVGILLALGSLYYLWAFALTVIDRGLV